MRFSSTACSMVAITGLAAPAQAQDYGWAHLRTLGEAPNRQVIIYDQDSIAEAINPDMSIYARKQDRYVLAQVTIAAVSENPDEPSMISADYRINCRDRLYRPAATYTYWRDGAFTSEPDAQFRPIKDGTPLADLMPMVCKMAPKEARARRGAMIEPFTNADVPIADAWAKLLPGASLPTASANKSEQQLAAEQAYNGREEAYRRQATVEAQQARELLAKRAEDDRAFLNNLLAWKQSKGDGGNRIMHSWIGNTASNLRASWGSPDEVRSWGTGQQLIYTTYSSRGIFRGNAQVGQEEYYCHQSFFTDRGYVVSWSTEGNNC